MAKRIVRLVTREVDGSLRTRDYENVDTIVDNHEQIGIDDCSTDLGLRGWPIFRGLIGPMPDGKGIARYESPDVFESVTKDWANAKTKRRRRRTKEQILADARAEEEKRLLQQ
ncbi:MAG: hypothetical protein VX768_19440 [Planctomycetota bacterium]|nr:hypothetical protein [Planctomycetota bacterium]